eukprot:scaffold5646_cov53-Attheya_sp.AAC.2
MVPFPQPNPWTSVVFTVRVGLQRPAGGHKEEKMRGSSQDKEPYRRSLMDGMLPLTFRFCLLTFFLWHCTERPFMVKMRVHVSSQAAGVSKNQNGGYYKSESVQPL